MYFDIDREKPTLTGLNSALRFNPGLSIIPHSDIHGGLVLMTSRSTLITEGFASELMAFIYPYQKAGDRVELMQCAKDDGTYVFDRTRPCAYDLNSAWPYSLENIFEYDGENPFFILKMNKIYGWLPDPVEGADGVIVKCEGVTLDDQINMGEVRYHDLDNHYSNTGFAARAKGKKHSGTFHSDFFPYVNQQWYLQPIVWVVFNEMKRERLTRVQCYLIAKNIHVDFATGEGSIRFLILVE
nr:sodium:potassium dependent atpase beta subunit [Hymenolepis microstoma]